MSSGLEPWVEYDSHKWSGEQLLCFVGDHQVIPTIPNELSKQGQEFLKWALTRDPTKRPDAAKLLLHPFITGDSSQSSAVELAHVGGASPKEMAQLESIRKCIAEDDKVKTMQMHASQGGFATGGQGQAQNQQQQQQQEQQQMQQEQMMQQQKMQWQQQQQQQQPQFSTVVRMQPAEPYAAAPVRLAHQQQQFFHQPTAPIRFAGGNGESFLSPPGKDRSEAILRVPAGAQYPPMHSHNNNNSGGGGSIGSGGSMSDSMLFGDSNYSGDSASSEGGSNNGHSVHTSPDKSPMD